MKSFIRFLIESRKDDFINRHIKIFKDHPTISEDPEKTFAKTIFNHTHGLGLGHHESIFANRAFLDKTLKPNEDELSIRQTINKWNKAKKEGLVTGEISSHSFESARSALKKVEKPDTDPETVPRSISPGLKNYHIGTIEHPEHGTLNVYHISHKQIGDNMNEYSRLSDELKKHSCKDNTHCVIGDDGPKHLKRYSKGHGFLLYTGKNNKTTFAHGFSDRGIVNPDNSLVSPEEHKFLSSKTHSLLPESHKEIYHFINSDQKDLSLEKQEKMYNQYGDDVGHYFISRERNTHPKIITKLLDHKEHDIRRMALKHPNVTPEHINKALDDEYPFIRIDAIEHPNVTTEHISKALRDGNKSLRISAIKHPNVTPEHISKALSDIEPPVRMEAIKHPNATPEHISKALRDVMDGVRLSAIKHPNVTPEHISKALGDRDPNVRLLAIKHPKVTPEHISIGLKDEDFFVRDSAERYNRSINR